MAQWCEKKTWHKTRLIDCSWKHVCVLVVFLFLRHSDLSVNLLQLNGNCFSNSPQHRRIIHTHSYKYFISLRHRSSNIWTVLLLITAILLLFQILFSGCSFLWGWTDPWKTQLLQTPRWKAMATWLCTELDETSQLPFSYQAYKEEMLLMLRQEKQHLHICS